MPPKIRTLVLIPARQASTRLADKVLADIHGEAMIVHVWRRATEAAVGDVVVACDTPAIAAAVEAAGGRAHLTRPDHPSGSDRIFEALCAIDPNREVERVVNVQGDLPTIEAASIRAAIDLLDDDAVDIATIAAEIRDDDERTNPNVVKIIAGFAAGAGGPGRWRLPRDRAIGRRPALPSHRALCLSPSGARTLRRAGAEPVGAA